MVKLVVFCSVISTTFVLAVQAYDFDNHVYNQILAQDLEHLYSSSDLYSPRVRRDVEVDKKCPPFHRGPPKLCCADNLLASMHDNEKDIKKSCFKEITGKDRPDKKKEFDLDPFDCEKAQKRREDLLCVFQCVGHKKELVDDAGNIKEDEISKYLKAILSEAPYLASAENQIITPCIEEAKNISRIRTVQKEKCNPAIMNLNFCLFKQIQLNCPADQITDQKACSSLQDKLKKGINGMPGSPPPPPPAIGR